MVIGYHVIIGAYGFWLPNDPRGSWSDFVWSWELFRRGGPPNKYDSTWSQAHEQHDHAARIRAKSALKYPPVVLTGVQARAAGRGFGNLAARSKLEIYACSILPEHVHLILARHRYEAEKAVNLLKGAATRQLLAEGIHPMSRFSVTGESPLSMWSERQWIVYIDSERDLERAIQYVEENPVKEGKPRQRWSFVTPYACV